jgi:hypothetical protein
MRILIILTFLFSSTYLIGQDKQNMFFISVNYDLQSPLSDLKIDYGPSSGVGIDFSMLTTKNIYWSVSNSFMFGNNVKDTTILNHLMDDNRNIIDQNGQIADITLQQRGFNSNFKLGYLHPVFNESSGVFAYGFAGFHQNKTRIDVRNSTVPQLNDDYKKIYDKLRNGFSGGAFLGYMHVSQKNFTHFYAGLEYTRAFSQNRRTTNYHPVKEGYYNDSFLSFKLGWIIPISKRNVKEFYYF